MRVLTDFGFNRVSGASAASRQPPAASLLVPAAWERLAENAQ